MTDPHRILFLDTFSGISGDMFLGLLVDLGVDPDTLLGPLKNLDLAGWHMISHRDKRRGIEGSRIVIEIEEQHHHRTWEDIRTLLEKSPLEPGVRDLAIRIFQRIARAEAKIHGVAEKRVHFHEVGAMDSILDIVGAAVGLTCLGNPQVICTPLPFTTGRVTCAHGSYPLPAPATLEILQGLPLVNSDLNCELVTPTGAAIVAETASFKPFPDMTLEKTGYGMGTRDLPEQPNVLRGILGRPTAATLHTDRITVMETQVDDSNGEWLGNLMEKLFDAGALDVSFMPVQMKKNRPGQKITVIAEPAGVPDLSRLILQETSALGLRFYHCERLKLHRENRSFASSLGEAAVKLVFEGEDLLRITPEYDCCRCLAGKKDLPLPEVYRIITREADTHFRQEPK